MGNPNIPHYIKNLLGAHRLPAMQGPLKGEFLHRVCLSIWSPIHRGALNGAQAIFGLLQEAEDAGLVHTTGNYRDGLYYICNCCSCCYGVLRGLAKHPTPNTVVRSDFIVTIDVDVCIACGDCVDRCEVSALSITDDGICSVDEGTCIGCGLCASACTVEAISLRRRDAAADPPPVTLKDWMAERARERSLPPTDEY